MSKKTWIIGGVAVLAIAGATILGRSLNHANDSKGSTGSNKVTTLKVAHTQNYVPYDFVDEKGESDGYEGARNDIHLFTDYPAPVINWAVGPEGISLAEGREIFGGRTVLGGFENGKKGLLYTGDKAAIQAETKRIIAETGTTGLVIGADCTIPSDIDEERIEWVREAAAE